MNDAEAVRTAADPATSADVLAILAAENPVARPLIAQHPNAYPELLAWLASLEPPAAAQWHAPAATARAPMTNPFTGIPPLDFVRDGAATVLLFLALFYAWSGSHTSAPWYAIVSTIFVFVALGFGYVARMGAFGPNWNQGVNRLIRLLAGVPYIISVLVTFVFDAVNGSLIGPGVLIGVVGLVLAVQPRVCELSTSMLPTAEDRVWYGVTVGLTAVAALLVLGTGIASFVSVVDYTTGVTLPLTLLSSVIPVGVLALFVVGTAQRRAGWLNALGGLSLWMTLIAVLHFDSFGVASVLGIGWYPEMGESIHGRLAGGTVLAAAGAAALAPGIARVCGPRLIRPALDQTVRTTLVVVAAASVSLVIGSVSSLAWSADGGTDVEPAAVSALIVGLLGTTIAIAAWISARSGGRALALVAAGTFAFLGLVHQVVVVATTDEAGAFSPTGSWLSPVLFGVALVLLSVDSLSATSRRVAATFATPPPGTVPPVVPPMARAGMPPIVPPVSIDPHVARASDPSTPAAVLAEIAQDHPQARVAVALNPNAYPALLDWLSALDDPQVNAALARR